mgnify:CR=1 FL=1
MNRFAAVYLIPPSVFAAVLIGGGYGTGREVVEFFSRFGPTGGLAGLAFATALFAIIFGLTFDFARRKDTFEYVGFFRALIGKFWWAFEGLYLLLALLVLGVLSAAAENMLSAEFGFGTNTGLLITLTFIATLVFFGRTVLEAVLSFWTLSMYAVFVTYFFFVFGQTELSTTRLSSTSIGVDAITGGALYVMYNVAIAPVLLFAAHPIQTQREAFIVGLLTALVLMIPATLFHVSFSFSSTDVLNQPVPVYAMIDLYAPSWFRSLFVVALLGTLIQTGAGLIHGFIERLERVLQPDQDDAMPRKHRVSIAMGALAISWMLAQFGIIALIGQGYTAMGIAFAVIYVAPLCIRYTFLRQTL